ncbi:MAG TPA: CRTAC1 family protein [Candidatus Saccharimonadales bacterium]|nr:CRTAC1 family protein [Candidatus Saccharimonadales bacterium]
MVTRIFLRALASTGLSLMLAASGSAQTPKASEAKDNPASHFPQFEDVTEKSKINFRHSFGEQALSSILEATGSGAVWFDYNNDGLLDLYVLSGKYIEGVTDHSRSDGKDATNHLYRNNGDGTFTDVTEQAGVAGKGFSMGVAAGDYDNDGFEDLYVTSWNSAILYHNNGDGTFTDVTEKAGVQNHFFGVGAAWIDYDRDGKLDLFVGNYLKYDAKAKRLYYTADAFAGPLDYEGESNRLFHNNGDGTFTDVSEQAGIATPVGRAMGVTVGDFDNDGWPDIYVANDQMESYLYHNNHDGTFTNVSLEQNVAYGTNGDTPSAMGPIFADYDNDGALDLFVSDMRYHRLFRNSLKEGFFVDITADSGVARMAGQYVGWGDGIFDFDNDGLKDLYVVNGGLHWLIPMEDTLLRNNGNGTFSDISAQAGSYFKVKKVGRGGCFGDFDNDGYIDAFIVVLGGKGILVRAVPPAAANRYHWLTIKLIGTKSNRDGYGARIEAVAGELKQVVENEPSAGYLSQNDPRPHFGLGNHGEVDTLTIKWPSGVVQTLEHVKADQFLTIAEPGERKTAARGGKP